ncbi:hypothetical protein N7492_004573 [Penicillium capsulatum]|uniref:Uncharacterized protein n=1 Tax=Penicillium capsulatum TaxID=69766 RepID=A0A9W9IAQ4_9EURO|nr:hypothetical protein N7492_004573 [Penicillium capsulatum]
MPSESDLAVLLQSDPSTSSGDFCFDMLVQDKDHPGDDSTDGIVFHNKYCPGYGGLEVIKAYKETTDENGKKHSARTSWSNVTWALWSSNCENEDQAAGLWWLAHKNLVNPDTLKIIDEMRDDNEFETTERPGSGTYLVYTLKPRDDSKKEADPASRYFFALFGSPNGNGGYYILKDHMSALRKNIAEIRVYQQVSWDDDEEEYIDEDLPEMVFILSKRQR